MKLIYLLLIIISYYSCTTSREIRHFIPTEYFFPESLIGSGKTFIFIDQSNGDSSFHDLYHYKKDNETYLIRTTYSMNGRSDSLIYSNYKLLEIYSHFFSQTKATKASILSDTIIDDGSRLGKNILKLSYQSDSLEWSIRSESEFVKDTVFQWQGSSLPTIVIKTTYFSTLKNKFNNHIQTNFELVFFTYEASKTGTVKIKIPKTVSNKSKDINLVRIEDMSIKN